MGPVIACTVETTVVFVRELGLILYSLPALSVSFTSFIRSFVNTFTSFIWLPVTLQSLPLGALDVDAVPCFLLSFTPSPLTDFGILCSGVLGTVAAGAGMKG